MSDDLKAVLIIYGFMNFVVIPFSIVCAFALKWMIR